MTHGGDGGRPAAPSGGDPFGGDPFAGDPFTVGRPGASASQAPAPASRQQETNTLATLSVVFAFVFAPAGVILGHLALSQIHETGDRGRDRALVGVTLSYVFITVAVVALVVSAAGVHAR
jgi:eukaryotic-like serine/threonine-protein kinase